MKKPFLSMCLVAASLALAGCSTSSLLSGNRGPDAAAVPVGRNLAMPPDLQLPPPGSGTASAYQEPAPAPGTYSAAAASPPADDGVYGGAAAAPRRVVGGTQCKSGARAPDIYGCYNINKLNPDGTKKTQAQLSAELRTAMLEEKRRTNPNYGTFKNFGQLFN
jgi:hypothetical protein